MPSQRDGRQRRARRSGVRIERLPPANTIRWPPQIVALLGQIPDQAVAVRARVSVQSVRNERKRRGIPAALDRKHKEWTPEMIEMLGTDSDRAVGAELGMSASSVSRKRRLLGIPSYRPMFAKASGFRWTPRAVALLGTAPDGEIARRLGILKQTVEIQRNLRGIPPFVPGPRRVAWSEEMIGLLGRVSDTEIARCFGIGEEAVLLMRHELGVAPFQDKGWTIKRTAGLARLLRLPNREIVRETGISLHALWRLRREYGVPAPRVPKSSEWPAELLARLGNEPDEEIAADRGIRPATVAGKRRSLGIPARRTARYWSDRERALLGKLQDADVARLIGRSRQAVKMQRLKMQRRRSAGHRHRAPDTTRR